MLTRPDISNYFFERSFGPDLPVGILTPDELLERINHTHVDGDSTAQLRIIPITVQPLDEIDTIPSFQPNALFFERHVTRTIGRKLTNDRSIRNGIKNSGD